MPDPTYTTEKVASLIPFPGNARRGDVPVIVDSLHKLGQYKPIVVQLSTRHVLAGNHTLEAAGELERIHKSGPCDECTRDWSDIEVRWVDCDDKTAKRINLIDNRSADLGEYDSRALAELLRSLEGDYEATGYDGDYLSQLLEDMANEALDRDGEGEDDGSDDGAETDAGTLLALADVSVAEPRHQPTHGSRWQVGRHLLIVAKLGDEHHLWRDELDGRVFCPYPEPYLTVGTLAREAPLLLVQPNTYLAGHLLDKHEAFFPGTVEKLS